MFFYGISIGIVQSLKVHGRGRCYDIAFDRIANCNYMLSNNLNYNPPGI